MTNLNSPRIDAGQLLTADEFEAIYSDHFPPSRHPRVPRMREYNPAAHASTEVGVEPQERRPAMTPLQRSALVAVLLTSACLSVAALWHLAAMVLQ